MPEEVIRNDPENYSVRSAFTDVVKRISWSAVWAGVMAALGMEVLFTLFGLFIGFGMYNWQAANPWAGISEWTTVWYLVTAAWSMFFGAWCAARLSGDPLAGDGILHGVCTWGLVTVATIGIVAVTSWAVLREGVNVLTTAAIASAPAVVAQVPAAPVPQAGQAIGQVQADTGQMAQATASIISGLSLRIFGGVLLGFITCLFGGWLGRSRPIVVAPRDSVPVPTQRAA